MRTRTWALLVILAAPVAYGDTYGTLIKRYETQIKQQERQLKGLRKNLEAKEQDALRWQKKAETAKGQWTQTGFAVERARKMIRANHARRDQTHVRAEAAQSSAQERTVAAQTAGSQAAFWTTQLYKQQHTPRYFAEISPAAQTPGAVASQLAALSETQQTLARKSRTEEIALRTEELRWQNEERKQMLALDRYRHQQQTAWLHWQDAQQRHQSLAEERAQLEQSAQALRVMLGELREHRDQTVAARADAAHTRTALAHLRGTLPWPAAGTVTQHFGKQYSDKLQQWVISNGIKVAAVSGKPVRSIDAGKVLFARPFQQYGQLVIIQHPRGLTSVYGGLGQTQVKEGDVLAALDPIGTVGDAKSFYFELRHDEEPINPLVWLAPQHNSELSSRRTFK